MTAPAVDGSVLDRLDFDPTVPCDLPGHPDGLEGCDPAEPGRWLVLIAHWVPGCKPVPQVLCDSSLRSSIAALSKILAPPVLPPGMVWQANICGLCMAELHTTADLITIVQEL